MKTTSIIITILILIIGFLGYWVFTNYENFDKNLIKTGKLEDSKILKDISLENKNKNNNLLENNNNFDKNNPEEKDNNITTNEKMNVLVPKLVFDEGEDDFIVNFTKYRVPKTRAVLKATLKKLFEVRGGDSDGNWNGLKFTEVLLDENNKAIVKLIGNWYPAGDMSGLYFSREIDSAVFQYPNVQEIEVWLNDKIFDWCIDDESDGEGGCPDDKHLWKYVRK